MKKKVARLKLKQKLQLPTKALFGKKDLFMLFLLSLGQFWW